LHRAEAAPNPFPIEGTRPKIVDLSDLEEVDLRGCTFLSPFP
jgi:hypothetical protein